MIDTLQLYEELKRHLPPEAAEKIAHTFFHVYGELQESLTKKDLDEVRDSIHRLQETQDAFAKHLEAVDQRLAQLVDIQIRTEERLDSLSARMEELAEAQRRTEQKVEELAEAQRRTEERVDSLSVRMEELAEAQKRTEKALEQLAKAQSRLEKRMDETQKILGGLSMAVGYGLEDRVLPFLPLFAKETYGMDVRTVDRRFILMANGTYEEVNLYAEGSCAEGPCFLIGECKAQPGKKDADRFARKLSRLSKVLQGKVFSILVGYLFDPEVEQYARKKYPEIRLVKSSYFSLLYGKSAGWFMFEV